MGYNGENIVYNNVGEWYIQHAAEVDFFGSTIKEVNELSASKRTADIGTANSVRAGCFYAENVKDTTFNVNEKLSFSSEKGTEFPVYYNDKFNQDISSLLGP